MGSPGLEEAGAYLEHSRLWVEHELRAWLDRVEGWPPALHEACAYALLGGGKRLRPALVRLFGELGGASPEELVGPALALELLHTYSLVHDDLPCMDDDDLRRGRPTSHRAHGEDMAVLVGDALQAEAFGLLAAGQHDPGGQVALVARAVGAAGMVGGQVLDLRLPASTASAEEVRAVHMAKTAALIAASCEVGAVASGAAPGERELARQFGVALGLGFQAVDDVLDVVGDAATIGKTPGKDEALERATSVAVLGLDGARAEASSRADEARRLAGECAAEGQARLLGLVDLLLDRRS